MIRLYSILGAWRSRGDAISIFGRWELAASPRWLLSDSRYFRVFSRLEDAPLIPSFFFLQIFRPPLLPLVRGEPYATTCPDRFPQSPPCMRRL